MEKCSACGEIFDIGYKMPNGDCVCASYECCYHYCQLEGTRITQEEKSEVTSDEVDSITV